MCLNYNNNITVASFTGATAMTRVSTSGQCTYLYKVRQTPKDTRTGCQLFQSTYLYKVRRGVVTTHSYSSMKFPIIRLLAMLKGLIQIIIVTILLFNTITAMTMKEAFC